MAGDLVPTGEPGRYYNEAAGKVQEFVEVREGDFWDTVEQVSGAITAGTELKLFQTQTDKNLHHTNLDDTRRIPARNRFEMTRVGIHVRQLVGNTLTTAADILKVYEAGSLEFDLNKRRIAEGSLLFYQSGLGVQGAGNTENNFPVATNGIPVLTGAPVLRKIQPVNDKDGLNASVFFKNNVWITTGNMATLAGDALIMAVLHGDIEKPQGT